MVRGVVRQEDGAVVAVAHVDRVAGPRFIRCAVVDLEHLAHVLLGLAEGGDRAPALDGRLSGVVGGKGELEVPFVPVQEVPKVLYPAMDVLRGLKEFRTFISTAVWGMSCISPIAPVRDTA